MNPGRVVGIAACAVVLTGVVLAFAFLGTPQHARSVALDERRVSDLRSISREVSGRYDNKALPERLPPDMRKADPVTHRQYEYTRLTKRRYELCASFESASEMETDDEAERIWRHGTGRKCFTFDLRPLS